MKHYDRKYEFVYTNPRTLKKCNIDHVSTTDGTDVGVYQIKLRNAILDYQKTVFERLVRVEWLIRKFMYNDKSRRLFLSSGNIIDSAFGVFMRQYVGFDYNLFSRDDILRKVVTYIDDFFPGFNEIDPFDAHLKYPYQYVPFESLILVYQMEERMELLAEAEKEQMSILEFRDYVINYVYCLNEELGHDKYRMVVERKYPPYVKKNINYEPDSKS